MSLRLIMLAAGVISCLMVWVPVVCGLPDHALRTYRIFEAVRPLWIPLSYVFSVIGLVLSGVSLYRRDSWGLVGAVCSLSVLSGYWSGFVPVV
jgi:hypothetical protein